MKLIIGHSGLVGTTLCQSEKYDYYFNSSNIDEFNSICKDGAELTLTCLPATKWMVNKNVTQDFENITKIISIISKHNYSKVTLISTIDVYSDSPLGSNEKSAINVKGLNYGSNRYLFELLVKEYVKTDRLNIFRLPALFNKNIKKNVLFDLVNGNNLQDINLNSAYQWYNLDNLSKDISKLTLEYPDNVTYNLFTEPIPTTELVELFPSLEGKVGFYGNKVEYNYATILSESGYLYLKKDILNDIKTLVDELSGK